MGKDNREFQTFDMQLAAFLEVKGIRPTYRISDGRVTFAYPATPELYEIMNIFNDNASVPIITYLNTLRSLKNRVYAMRVQG